MNLYVVVATTHFKFLQKACTVLNYCSLRQYVLRKIGKLPGTLTTPRLSATTHIYIYIYIDIYIYIYIYIYI